VGGGGEQPNRRKLKTQVSVALAQKFSRFFFLSVSSRLIKTDGLIFSKAVAAEGLTVLIKSLMEARQILSVGGESGRKWNNGDLRFNNGERRKRGIRKPFC